MYADFIYPSDLLWQCFLDRCEHDVYHLAEYVEFSAWHERGIPVAFYAEDDGTCFLIPLVVRDIPEVLCSKNGYQDARTPYGYPSPLLHPPDDAMALRKFLRAFRERCRERGIVTTFFRMHPLLELPETLAEFGTLMNHGQTVSVDLTLPTETIWSELRQNHRRNITRLTAAGFCAEIDNWEHFDAFVALYHDSMHRINAPAFYHFGEDYFYRLRTALRRHLHLIVVLSPSNKLASGALFTTVNGIAQFHLGATNACYLLHAPSKLVFHTAIEWAKEAGNRVLHLGGGFGAEEDSLFQFKAGFSPRRHVFQTFRMVISEEDYAALNARWRALIQVSSGNSNFFPQYRQFYP